MAADGSTSPAALNDLIRCPRCGAPSPDVGAEPCGRTHCPRPFPVVGGQPVLVDFAESVIDRGRVVETAAVSLIPGREAGPLRRWLRAATGGTNRLAPANARRFLDAVKRLAPRPRVLVVGGGTVGPGIDVLAADGGAELVAFDVYASPHTRFVADGHAIPLIDGAVHGVWIQAVLEHVVEPQRVAGEIGRVLVEGGIVYAETPFLQAVHEGAYDFTRFTHSGHRWLFRAFEEIDSGPVGGPGTALLWAIRGVMRGLTRSDPAATLLTLPFAWVALFDRLVARPARIDSAWGVYFLGRKTATAALTHRSLVAYYAGGGPR